MKIKFFYLTLLLCLIFNVSARQTAIGDVNGDSHIDIVDALDIARYIVGLNPNPFIVSAADVSNDNIVNITDALLISQFYVDIIKIFPRTIINSTIPVEIRNLKERIEKAFQFIENPRYVTQVEKSQKHLHPQRYIIKVSRMASATPPSLEGILESLHFEVALNLEIKERINYFMDTLKATYQIIGEVDGNRLRRGLLILNPTAKFSFSGTIALLGKVKVIFPIENTIYFEYRDKKWKVKTLDNGRVIVQPLIKLTTKEFQEEVQKDFGRRFVVKSKIDIAPIDPPQSDVHIECITDDLLKGDLFSIDFRISLAFDETRIIPSSIKAIYHKFNGPPHVNGKLLYKAMELYLSKRNSRFREMDTLIQIGKIKLQDRTSDGRFNFENQNGESLSLSENKE